MNEEKEEKSKKMDKIYNKQRCNSIYWNLIELLTEKEEASAYFLREFYQTKRCDKIYDLHENRTDLQKYLGDSTLNNILDYKEDENPSDLKKVTQAVCHYYAWNRKSLLKALPWGSWLYYHTFYMVERKFATLGRKAIYKVEYGEESDK